jgi:ABC-type transport system involved in cytochrome c biogenesis permease subunit
MLGLAVAVTISLVLAYNSKRLSGPTVCFIAGVALLLFPLIGSIVGGVINVGIIAPAFAKLGENEGAPQAGALESEMSASVILALLVSAT